MTLNFTRTSTIILILFVLSLLIPLPAPPASASMPVQKVQLDDDGNMEVVIGFGHVLDTDGRFVFDIEVNWNGSGKYTLEIELDGKRYTRNMDESETLYALVISQNTFDDERLNSPVTFKLKKGTDVVDTCQATIDINYRQGGDLNFLYLGYTLLWGGLFVYLVFLHQGQERLTKMVEDLNTVRREDRGPSDNDE